MAVRDGAVRRSDAIDSLLLDSGSDDHFIRARVVEHLTTNRVNRNLEDVSDVQGSRVNIAGEIEVPLTLGHGGSVAAMPKFVSGGSFGDDGLSLGELLRNRFVFDFSLRDGLKMIGPYGWSIPLQLQRNSLRRVPARVHSSLKDATQAARSNAGRLAMTMEAGSASSPSALIEHERVFLERGGLFDRRRRRATEQWASRAPRAAGHEGWRSGGRAGTRSRCG